jgi:hypothetical protein
VSRNISNPWNRPGIWTGSAGWDDFGAQVTEVAVAYGSSWRSGIAAAAREQGRGRRQLVQAVDGGESETEQEMAANREPPQRPLVYTTPPFSPI